MLLLFLIVAVALSAMLTAAYEYGRRRGYKAGQIDCIHVVASSLPINPRSRRRYHSKKA